ncbi:DUF2269 family protein [Parachitinimonas caeni]|uniref:DUF2269 family protein n=1 Tax=Parachitinimonas caeni TaxID=3031301 RepID=A0ABT7DUX2_9NEIS|nr:DUF2269 family protein [Parachitinimonas caeni]MDK2123859.1 DUF2269 family protein [Parachitinimonas caeni]
MYEISKSLHILGACLFIGNIIVSAFWKVMADRTGDYAIIRFATRLVNLTDGVFTGLGVALLLGSGHFMATALPGGINQPWIIWSYVVFGISGGLWLLVLVPVQIKQSRLLAASNGRIPAEYSRLARIWSVVGTLATLIPLPAIFWMVAKAV